MPNTVAKYARVTALMLLVVLATAYLTARDAGWRVRALPLYALFLPVIGETTVIDDGGFTYETRRIGMAECRRTLTPEQFRRLSKEEHFHVIIHIHENFPPRTAE